ncbi:hypothetical protein [Mesorhizobium sp. M0159]|uniref:hypothetical protein n=1 Tax=Mesorhizobium sp. M0159 TaxID=2956900 RepID=UPI003339D343
MAKALRKTDLPARNVNPQKLRHYARALGRLAKNDRIDGLLIARYTAELPTDRCDATQSPSNSPIWSLPRRQLSDDKVSLTINSSKYASRTVKRMFTHRLRHIELDVALLAKRMSEILASQPGLAARV